LKHPELFPKLEYLLQGLRVNINHVSRAYFINNPMLATSFQNLRDFITNKHFETPDLFKKDDWKKRKNYQQRKRFLDIFADKINQHRYLWNDGSKAFIVPMIQGTTENAALHIAKNGFGITSSLDSGWFGKGIYFTSLAKYASIYAEKGETQPFLICLTIPGNVFPVTEAPFLKDKPSQQTPDPDGFFGQSHYTIVNKDGLPLEEGEETPDGSLSRDELVIFDAAQCLPGRG